jgi:hypothetical protein
LYELSLVKIFALADLNRKRSRMIRKLTKSGRAPLRVVVVGERRHVHSVPGYEVIAGIG